jgi:hypothetical protein
MNDQGNQDQDPEVSGEKKTAGPADIALGIAAVVLAAPLALLMFLFWFAVVPALILLVVYVFGSVLGVVGCGNAENAATYAEAQAAKSGEHLVCLGAANAREMGSDDWWVSCWPQEKLEPVFVTVEVCRTARFTEFACRNAEDAITTAESPMRPGSTANHCREATKSADGVWNVQCYRYGPLETSITRIVPCEAGR